MSSVQLTDDPHGVTRELVRTFGDDRGIVLYDGIYVMVDRIHGPGSQVGEVWEMSGEPARPGEELDALNALAATVQTTTTVTKDDDST